MEAKPRRRWFSFSLRTLFVVVTILSLWLGWQMKIVRERKAILDTLMVPGDSATNYITLEQLESNPFQQPADEYDYVRVPWLRRLLGDHSYLQISTRNTVDRRILEQAEHIFPEAYLIVLASKDPRGDELWIEASRDSLYVPADKREFNFGDYFKTGLLPKQ